MRVTPLNRVSCGCCSNGHACANHADIPRGIPIHPCDCPVFEPVQIPIQAKSGSDIRVRIDAFRLLYERVPTVYLVDSVNTAEGLLTYNPDSTVRWEITKIGNARVYFGFGTTEIMLRFEAQDKTRGVRFVLEG
jgi:hypothetical protein